MQIEFLKKFEGKQVRIILKNNFTYTCINFKIVKGDLVEIQDKFGEHLTIEPNYVSAISEINQGES